MDIASIAKNSGRKVTAKCNSALFFKVGFFFLSFHSFFLLSIVSGVNSGSVSTDPPRSPSKTLPICLLSSPIQLSISVLSNCVPTTSWRLSTPVSKRMRSKGSRLTSS